MQGRFITTEVDVPLRWFGNACVDKERYSHGQVAEAALPPETRTERRELSMVNLGGGMRVALQGRCIATEVDMPLRWFWNACVDKERYSRGQVAEAALTPKTHTERRELSMVNLGGGM